MTTVRRTLLILLQTGIALGLLGWIFREPSFRHQAWEVVTGADWRWFGLGMGIALVDGLIGTARWRLFLSMNGIHLPWWKTVQVNYIGLFFNLFFVGSVGGDAVKVLILAAEGQGKMSSLLSVVMDRVSGFAALVTATILFTAFHYDWLMASPIVAKGMVFVFLFLGLASLSLILSFAATDRRVRERMPAWMPGRKKALEWVEAYSLFASHWPKSLAAAAISCVMLVAYFSAFYCSARAFGARVPLFDFFALMPIVDTITAMPISLGGIGVREQVFVVLLRDLFALAAPLAVSISLGGFLIVATGALPGALFLPFYRTEIKREREAETVR